MNRFTRRGSTPDDAAGEIAGPDDELKVAAIKEAERVEREAKAPGEDLEHPADERPDLGPLLREPLTEKFTVRMGVYAWSMIGITLVLIGLSLVIAELHAVVVPLVLALFPAAVLQPFYNRLRAMGIRPALGAAIVVLGTLGIITGIVTAIAPAVGDQLDTLQESIRDGYGQVEDFLASGPLGLQPIRLDDLIDRITNAAGEEGGLSAVGSNALGFARALFEGATSMLLMLIVTFFYIKDGPSIARWLQSLFPRNLHEDVRIIGNLTWTTIGGYIQAQLIVALIDALFIGLGLWILQVPLALPLGVIVFFGGLFPIIGASVSGSLAALVALATNGLVTAGLVIAVVIAVQFLEGHLLLPLIVGRVLDLNPLAVILALAIGGILLGILGAFLAVPVAAASAKTAGYLRQRIPG